MPIAHECLLTIACLRVLARDCLPASLPSTAVLIRFTVTDVQVLEYAFYYTFFHSIALSYAYLPPSEPLACWATVVAGGYLQAQATYVASSAFKWVDFGPLESLALPAAFWALSALLALAPALYAARCWQVMLAA